MGSVTLHREDVKAELRKRFGTLEAFSEARGLAPQQVRDLLRGKSSAAHVAVARELGIDPDEFIISSDRLPLCGNHSHENEAAHRLNAGAR